MWTKTWVMGDKFRVSVVSLIFIVSLSHSSLSFFLLAVYQAGVSWEEKEKDKEERERE